MAGSRTLGDVAEELYALVPEGFTAARDAAARAARDEGDRMLAAQLKQLRRPSLGAWLVNQLVRNHLDRLDDLLDLGATLREAQDALDGAELRTMSRQRHQVIRSLAGTAGELAAAAGQHIGDPAKREFEATLDAALADENAAHAVRSGRLMRALSSSGLEPVDLTDAVGAPNVETCAPRSAARVSKQTIQKPTATKQAIEKPSRVDGSATPDGGATPAPSATRAAAQRAIGDARTELDAAERELSQRKADVVASRTAVTDARNRVAELDAALAQARERQSAAELTRREADQTTRSATRRRDAAQRALIAAEKKLTR